MTAPEFGDAPTTLKTLLQAAMEPGTVEINILEDQAGGFTRGLSAGATGVPPTIVFIQEVGGTTPLHLLQEDVRVEVITYTRGAPSTARAMAKRIQRALWLSVIDQVVTPSGSLRFMRTDTRPYVQQLAGIPATIVRTSATYTFGHRSR